MELNMKYLRILAIRRAYEDSKKIFLDRIGFGYEYSQFISDDQKKKANKQIFEATIIILAIIGFIIEKDFKVKDEYLEIYQAFIGVKLDELSNEKEYAEIFFTDDFELFMTMYDRINFYKQEIQKLIENYIYEPPYGILYYFHLNPGNYSPYAEYTIFEEQEVVNSIENKDFGNYEMGFVFALKDIYKFILNRLQPQTPKNPPLVDFFLDETFPDGNSQIEQELKEIEKLLNSKHPREILKQKYILVSAGWFTTQRIRVIDNILDLKSLLPNSESTITEDEIILICDYAIEKFNKNEECILYQNTIHELFTLAKWGVFMLQSEYNELSNAGKIEALILNSLFVLQVYDKNYSYYFNDEFSENFIKLVIGFARRKGLKQPPDEIVQFINSRFELFSNELSEFFDNDESHLLNKIYTILYESPLDVNPKVKNNHSEYVKFLPSLMKIRRYIIEKAAEIL